LGERKEYPQHNHVLRERFPKSQKKLPNTNEGIKPEEKKTGNVKKELKAEDGCFGGG